MDLRTVWRDGMTLGELFSLTRKDIADRTAV
jgi:hypothetical protein